MVACYVRTFRRGVTAKGWRRCLAHSRQLWGCSAPPRCSQSQGALWLRNEYLARSRPRSHRSRSLLRSANMGFGGNQLGNQERAAAIEVIFSWSINTKRGVDHQSAVGVPAVVGGSLLLFGNCGDRRKLPKADKKLHPQRRLVVAYQVCVPPLRTNTKALGGCGKWGCIPVALLLYGPLDGGANQRPEVELTVSRRDLVDEISLICQNFCYIKSRA